MASGQMCHCYVNGDSGWSAMDIEVRNGQAGMVGNYSYRSQHDILATQFQRHFYPFFFGGIFLWIFSLAHARVFQELYISFILILSRGLRKSDQIRRFKGVTTSR